MPRISRESVSYGKRDPGLTSNDAVLGQQVDEGCSTILVGPPDAGAPGFDGLVALRAGRVPEDIGGGEGATVGGKREGGPRAFLGGEADVDLLDLPAGHVLFEMQVEAEEREDDGDWFLLRVRELQRDRVDSVLVDERRVAVRESAGEARKAAIAAVAAEAGVPKRDVFDAVVAAKTAAGPR